MKILFNTGIAVLVMIALCGCLPGLKNTKPSPGAADLKSRPLPEPGLNERPKGGQIQEPPVAKGSDPRMEEGPADLQLKDEVNRAALEFAEKNVRDVEHVKTCFSRVDGVWNMMLYVRKKKRMSVQQFVWNKESREWEPTFKAPDMALNEVEFHLKGELSDEKCFVLK
jgi:hypothetical protein